MKDFGTWFATQGNEEPQELEPSFWLRCTGCGKDELVDRAAFENGDSWYSEDPESGEGLCLGSQRCVL